ncbi:MAG: CBS domain-containing protein [Labilithrix sp.]|nr:CBS domain-containing protein [Labilithrix sp.]MCW5831310.1 CBS domain-containing protein [Labilithrix sp.]
MLCRELMRTPVVSSHLDAPASQTAALMRTRKLGFIPVCDERGRVVGTVTDRDLAIRVLAECQSASSARLLASTPLRYVMTPGPITCLPDDELELAEDLMRRYHKSRIVCVDAERRPVGVISLSDIARRDRADRVGELLRAITEREVTG